MRAPQIDYVYRITLLAALRRLRDSKSRRYRTKQRWLLPRRFGQVVYDAYKRGLSSCDPTACDAEQDIQADAYACRALGWVSIPELGKVAP
jgi:hypothetical protein